MKKIKEEAIKIFCEEMKKYKEETDKTIQYLKEEVNLARKREKEVQTKYQPQRRN